MSHLFGAEGAKSSLPMYWQVEHIMVHMRRHDVDMGCQVGCVVWVDDRCDCVEVRLNV